MSSPLSISKPVKLDAPSLGELSWLEVDLRKIDQNLLAIREAVDHASTLDEHGRPLPPSDQARTMLCAVVKKDAYGLGSVQIAHRLVKQGVDMLAVYSPDEAEHLISNAVTAPILVLMPMRELNRTDGLYRHAVAEKLHLSIHDTRQLAELNNIGQQLGIKLPCHLYIDTGMSRSGLTPAQALDVLRSTDSHKYVRIAGVFTHFASSETNAEFTFKQLDQFNDVVKEAGPALPPDAIRHAANTKSLLRSGTTHLDMVRFGIGLYGFGGVPEEEPGAGPWLSQLPELAPVVRWCSRVIHIQQYKKRTPVSYGSTHKLKRDAVLGIVPVGHGDGYPVALSNKAEVRVHPKDRSKPVTNCKVVGTVSMDQIVVDLTDLCDDVKADNSFLLDAWAEIISPDRTAPNSLPNLAKIAKTNAYEMLCRLSPGIPRRYIY
ncbi:MAG: alanine racemase [Phycisphaeraceae bacterium]